MSIPLDSDQGFALERYWRDGRTEKRLSILPNLRGAPDHFSQANLHQDFPSPAATDPRTLGHSFAPPTPTRAALSQTAPLAYPTPITAASSPRWCSEAP